MKTKSHKVIIVKTEERDFLSIYNARNFKERHLIDGDINPNAWRMTRNGRQKVEIKVVDKEGGEVERMTKLKELKKKHEETGREIAALEAEEKTWPQDKELGNDTLVN